MVKTNLQDTLQQTNKQMFAADNVHGFGIWTHPPFNFADLNVRIIIMFNFKVV